MNFEIIGPLENSQTFAKGQGIRELKRLIKTHGKGHWRKRKGFARIRLSSGLELYAELHWYEANGIGKKEFKIKEFIDKP